MKDPEKKNKHLTFQDRIELQECLYKQMTFKDITIGVLQGLIGGMSSDTAKDIKSLLSYLYKIACAQGDVTTNLTRYMTLPDNDEKEAIPFNRDKLKALWTAYSSGDTWVGYILLMIFSGMMPGELLICRKDMIDFENHRIMRCGLKTKVRKRTPIVIAEFHSLWSLARAIS